ncbi:MAG: DUF2935 domain-containing protein, partial [Nitrosopumilus sp.]|nr:DUF2935 domain-containing protein [Nitrosopumilus sp.]
MHVKERLDRGEKLGWVYPSLAKHILKEERYFKSKLMGNMPINYEIAYINKHHEEELGTTAQLLDPKEQSSIDLVRSYAMKEMSKIREGKSLSGYKGGEFPKMWTHEEENLLKSKNTNMNNEEINKFLQVSIRYSKEIVEFNKHVGPALKNGQLASIIEDFLVDHVLREYIRFEKTLELLQTIRN